MYGYIIKYIFTYLTIYIFIYYVFFFLGGSGFCVLDKGKYLKC